MYEHSREKRTAFLSRLKWQFHPCILGLSFLKNQKALSVVSAYSGPSWNCACSLLKIFHWRAYSIIYDAYPYCLFCCYALLMTTVCPSRQVGALEPRYYRWRVRHHVASQLWLGGGGVCPKPRLKGRRGRVVATSKLPAARAGHSGGYFFGRNWNEKRLFTMHDYSSFGLRYDWASWFIKIK